VSVIDWLASRLAIVASAGSYPVDLTQGYPGGRFVSLALRIASRDTRAIERAAASTAASVSLSGVPATDAPGEAAASAFEVRTTADNLRTLRVDAPSARSVELSGDFTHWQSVRLTRDSDGWWVVTLPIAPGTYQLNIRLDGGHWAAPPGLLTSTDEFGAIAGILTIE
jgi:hypothetical protein